MNTSSSSTSSITSSSTSTTITSTLSPSAYAINVANIKNLIPLTLDLQASNYSKWRTLVLVTLGKFGLRHHIDGTEPQHDDSDWVQQDFTVLSWLYGTISMEILDIVMQVDATAFAVWTSIENLFRDNKRSHALQLEADFRNTIQGDLSISDYCHRLKTLADALGDVGQPVSDETLVLTTLRGLNENFATLATILPMQSPFLSFIQTRSLLLLEENRRINTSKQASATAFSPPTVTTSTRVPPAIITSTVETAVVAVTAAPTLSVAVGAAVGAPADQDARTSVAPPPTPHRAGPLSSTLLLMLLNLYTVIYGLLLYLVFLATNITWLFSMTTPTTYGLSRCALNLKSTPPLLTSTHTSPHIFTRPLRTSNAIMAVNLTTI